MSDGVYFCNIGDVLILVHDTIMMENVPPVTEEDILQDNLRAHVMHVVPHPSHNPIAHQKLQLLGGPHAPVTL